MADGKTLALVGGVLALLAAATAVGQFLKLYPESGLNAAVVERFNHRLRAWWLMCSVLAAALAGSATPPRSCCSALISFWALREFITLTPTRLGDHRTLFWVFFLFTPLQYVLVGMTVSSHDELYNVLIPVYAFLFILARVARVGRLQAISGADGQDSGRPDDLRLLLELRPGPAVPAICRRGGSASQRPAAVLLHPDGAAERRACTFPGAGWSGRHVIAPTISPSKTWEGFSGRHRQRHAARRRPLVGHALRTLGRRRHVAGHLA